MSQIQGVVTDEDLAAQRQRNAEQAARIVAAMGTKYVCHPANIVRRDPMKANFSPVVFTAPATVRPLVLLKKGGGK